MAISKSSPWHSISNGNCCNDNLHLSATPVLEKQLPTNDPTIEVTDNNWLALNNIGLYYLNNGHLDEAIQFFQESVKVKPSYIIARLNLGTAHSMKNDQRSAVDAFKQVLNYDPARIGILGLPQGRIAELAGDRVLKGRYRYLAVGAPLTSVLTASL